jgi:hypothetical protein
LTSITFDIIKNKCLLKWIFSLCILAKISFYINLIKLLFYTWTYTLPILS